MSDELKPCPFCGKTGEYFLDPIEEFGECDGIKRIRCLCCDSATDYVSSEESYSAETIWNRRPIEDAQAARIAELESQVDDLQGELAQSDKVSRIMELEAERDRLRAALRWLMNTVDGCLTPREAEGWKRCQEALKGGGE